jgi:predicted DNA-binding ribbon-helix-helix protein
MQTMIRRSIIIAGHQTSVSLEDSFWNRLKDIAGSQEVTLSELVDDIDMRRLSGNLASAIRQFVLAHYQGHKADGSMASSADIHR